MSEPKILTNGVYLFVRENRDLPELHVFAKNIGLKREWFHDDYFPHYELQGTVKKEALRRGAVDVDREALSISAAWEKRRGKFNKNVSLEIAIPIDKEKADLIYSGTHRSIYKRGSVPLRHFNTVYLCEPHGMVTGKVTVKDLDSAFDVEHNSWYISILKSERFKNPIPLERLRNRRGIPMEPFISGWQYVFGQMEPGCPWCDEVLFCEEKDGSDVYSCIKHGIVMEGWINWR